MTLRLGEETRKLTDANASKRRDHDVQRPLTRIGALRPNGAKMTQKKVHGLKIGRPMNLDSEIDISIERWWRGRAKWKIVREFVDSFTMQDAPAAGDNVEKGPGQTCLILGIEKRLDLSKLHLLGSVYSTESENAVHCLDYKGCELAILDATEQVGFGPC